VNKDLEVKKKDQSSIKIFLSNRLNTMNLLTFIAIGVACSTVFYMINFYIKYLPGDIFLNQSMNSLSQVLANVVTIFLSKNVSNKKGLTIAFIMCVASCSLVIVS